MKLVIIESPYAGTIAENVNYGLECLRDSLLRGEAPFASHLLYTRSLDDAIRFERRRGMAAGYAWLARADLIAVYRDRGLSRGMLRGIRLAMKLGKPIEFRSLNKEAS